MSWSGHDQKVSVPRSVIGHGDEADGSTVRSRWFQRELDRELDAERSRAESAAPFGEIAVAVAQVTA